MNTSGTFGANLPEIAKIIDTAFRRCGKMPSSVSGELLLAARDALFYLLSSLADRGLSLWLQQKSVIGMVPGQELYTLPAGTVDVLRVMHRTDTVVSGTLLTGGTFQGADLAYMHKVSTVSNSFITDTSALNLLVQQSQDGVTWSNVGTWNFTAPALGVNFLDLDGAPAAQFWQLITADGSTLPVIDALAWHEQPNELQVDKMNRDGYQSLPNRHVKGPRVLEYWYDKQITPRVWVWPVPDDDTSQLVVWVQRHVQDPGALNGNLEIPQRWLDPIIMALAARVALEIPPAELPPGRLEYLEGKSGALMDAADTGESDGSPIVIQPNIRGYTR